MFHVEHLHRDQNHFQLDKLHKWGQEKPEIQKNNCLPFFACSTSKMYFQFRILNKKFKKRQKKIFQIGNA